MSRGSVWRKWDLHVHTPASFHHEFKFLNEEEREKYQNNVWEKYIDELEKISDVPVIGITDYFTIEGYKKVLVYREEGRLQNFELILPNIEFRLTIITEENKRLNIHLIFSDSIRVEDINDFLARIKLALSEPRVQLPQGVSCTRNGLIQVGKTYKNDETLPDDKAYKIGCTQAVIDFNQLLEELASTPNLKGNHFVIGVEDSPGGLSEIPYNQSGHLRTEIYRKCHIIESSNQETIKFWLGKSRKIHEEELIQRFGSLKPCIHGSDAHSFEKLFEPDEDRFCWIKADPSFEGLKQIIYEPEERIRIQPENPESRKNIYTLSSIKINNSWISNELSIEEQDIPLNRNLAAVTGGKGSGKTALLDLIANCFEDRCERAGEDRNSFVQRIEDQKQDLKVEIGFIGEDIEKFSKELIEKEFFRDSKITYLPQGKIEEYSGDRQKLDKKIEEIIFSNKEVIDKGYKQEFDRLREEIGKFVKEIDEINREIYDLEEETKKEVIRDIESKKGIKDGELKNKEDELRKLTESLEEGIRESIAKLKDEETELRVKHSKFEGIKSTLEQFKSKLGEFLGASNKTINDVNRELSELEVNLTIPQLDFKLQLNAIKKTLEVIPQKITDVTKQIDKRKKQLSQLSGVEKTHAELLKERESIKTVIESLKKQLKELNEKKEKRKSLETERGEKYLAFLSKYWKWKESYDEVIRVFSIGKSEILGGIDFESSIYFDKSRFVELGSDILDQRRINIDEIEKYAQELETIITESTQETLAKRLEEFMQKIFEKKDLLKRTRTNYDFYKWIFGNYVSPSTKILFKERPMGKLSIGQKGTILLKLFLAEGDYPLIVDQPEENLDNKFIYGELVGAFREAKKKRQVIIATNNANLVVNTDTEQIIVAEFENNRISYKLGSLENLEMREDIMPILEGGKEAFLKREEKYGI